MLGPQDLAELRGLCDPRVLGGGVIGLVRPLDFRQIIRISAMNAKSI